MREIIKSLLFVFVALPVFAVAVWIILEMIG